MQEGLFERKTSDEIKFWDIVRYDVFYFIFRDCLSRELEENGCLKNNKNRFSLSKITAAFKNLFADYKYLYINRKQKYVFFKCSRNFINGQEIDIVSDDYLRMIGDECFIIETFGNSRDSYCFLNSVLRYKKKINKLFKRKIENYCIDEIINNTFALDVHLNNFIGSNIENFRVERMHYRKLLKKLNPQAVFFVQKGIQKGLMYSCGEVGTLSIELQHGIINYCHQAYSYPNGIEKYKQNEVIVPDVLFGFSDYWIKNVNYPVKESIAMGNTHYSILSSLDYQEQNEITFISSDIDQKKIESFLDYMLETEQDIRINLKLHPNQKNERNQIYEKYSKYKNVSIYYNEVTLHELFKRSREVILVTSTAAYEAIQFGCNVKIIRDALSYNIEELFDHTNVIVIDEPIDIFNKYKKEPVNTVFFDVFNECKMKKFIEYIEEERDK